MNGLHILLAPLALLLPSVADEAPESKGASNAAQSSDVNAPTQSLQAKPPKPLTLNAEHSQEWQEFVDAFQSPSNAQVRIQRRVTIRVAPRRTTRSFLVADTRTRENRPQPRFEERKMNKCIAVGSIAGVHTEKDRLVLFMRDRGLVTARMNKKCKARDFYSGFLVEKNEDGKLCVKRDVLQSRVGTKCKVKSFHKLVQVRN